MVNKFSVNKKAQDKKSKIFSLHSQKRAQGRKLKFSTPHPKRAQKQKTSFFQLTFNKKGQMKIQQMAFMLIAVTLFFAIVGVLVIVIKFSGLKGSASSLQEEDAKLLVTKLANLPEFSCGSAFGNQRTNCIDEDKLMILSNNLENYKDFWGKLNIEFRIIYPFKEETLCKNSNYPDCNFIQLGTGNVSGDFSNFVSLCRKEKNGNLIENKCQLAKIYVNYEDIK